MDNNQNNQNNPQTPQTITPDNQSAAPDYSFIQSYDTPPPQNPKGLGSRKYIALIAIVLFMLVGLGAVILGQQKSGNQPVPKTPEAASKSSVFVQNITDGQFATAYSRLSDGLKQTYSTQSEFDRLFARSMKTMLETNKCEPVQYNESYPESIVYKCNIGSTSNWTGFGLTDRGTDEEAVYKVCRLDSQEINACQ